MASSKLKICAKGSRKTGKEFIEETKYLASIADCIEIDFNYPHDRNFTLEMKFLRKLRKDKKISYAVHSQYLSGSLNDFNEIIRKETIRQACNSIDNAKKIGAKVVTIHPALEPYGLKIEKGSELELDSYKKIAAYASKKGILIGLENEARTNFWFPDRACKLELLTETIKKVGDSKFGLTLDIGHANISGEDYLSAISKYSSMLFHVHAHDNYGDPETNIREFKRPDPHLAPGQGKINWKEIIKTLEDTNYQGMFELECKINELDKAIQYIKSLE